MQFIFKSIWKALKWLYLLTIGCIIRESTEQAIQLSTVINKHHCVHHSILQHFNHHHVQERNYSDIQKVSYLDVLNAEGDITVA
jgi:hypothetical protein